MLDSLSRPLRNLRLSVTDRCNLRCQYCMPEADYVWLPREDVLHFEEISVLVDLFLELGVDRVRLTGGEPLLRRDLPSLVRMLSQKSGLKDLALTTNGVLLAEQVEDLKAAGLGRLTVSLDTLHRDRFVALTRFDELERVKAGISAAKDLYGRTEVLPYDNALPYDSKSEPHDSKSEPYDRDTPEAESLGSRPKDGEDRAGLGGGAPSHKLKLDSVVIRGVNDDELVDLIEYGKSVGAEVRFIEYMDVGGATQWSQASVVPRSEMLARLTTYYGSIAPLADREASAPADRYALSGGTTFGIIASTTEPFCRTCDRSRLTADGMWYLCLYAAQGIDLRRALRAGAATEELKALISSAWSARNDRGAEARLALGERRGFVPVQTLRGDPHLEMHTRGG